MRSVGDGVGLGIGDWGLGIGESGIGNRESGIGCSVAAWLRASQACDEAGLPGCVGSLVASRRTPPGCGSGLHACAAAGIHLHFFQASPRRFKAFRLIAHMLRSLERTLLEAISAPHSPLHAMRQHPQRTGRFAHSRRHRGTERDRPARCATLCGRRRRLNTPRLAHRHPLL
ncbi:hypothetical protein EIQ14_07405 [Xanthomonas campestris pv. campestris]